MVITRPGVFSPQSQGLPTPPVQTSFLGATVIDFSTAIGWGADSSTFSVNLIEDDTFVRPADPRVEGYAPLVGGSDDWPYALAQNGLQYIADGPETDSSGGPAAPDGYGNHIIDQARRRSNLPPRAGSSLYSMGDFFWTPQLGSPVYFNFNGWKFNGIFKSYSRDYGTGGEKFSVNIESPAAILRGVQVILGGYMGTTAPPTPLTGGIACGAGIYNLINVFGYYEHADFGGGFGQAGKNTSGLIWHDPTRGYGGFAGPTTGGGGVLPALEDIINNSAKGKAFGGPIYYGTHPNKSGGGTNGEAYKYRIDLSELSSLNTLLPRYYRINQTNTTLIGLIEEVCGIASCDFSVILKQPSASEYADGFYGTIKINVMKRHTNPVANVVKKHVFDTELDPETQKYGADGTPLPRYAISSKVGAAWVDKPKGTFIVGAPATRVVGAEVTTLNSCGGATFPPGDMDEARIGSPGAQSIWPIFGVWERAVPAIIGPQGQTFGGVNEPGLPILAGTQNPSASNINAIDVTRDFSGSGPIFDIPIDCLNEGYPLQMLGYPYGPVDPTNFNHPGQTPSFTVNGVHLASITELRIASTGQQEAWESYLKTWNIPVARNLGILSPMGAFNDWAKSKAGQDAISAFDMSDTSKKSMEEAQELYSSFKQEVIGKIFGKIQGVAQEYFGKHFLVGLPFVPASLSEQLRVECLDEPSAWTGSCTPSKTMEEAWGISGDAWVEMGNPFSPIDPRFYSENGRLSMCAKYNKRPLITSSVSNDFSSIDPESYVVEGDNVWTTASSVAPVVGVGTALPKSPTITWYNALPYAHVTTGPVYYTDPNVQNLASRFNFDGAAALIYAMEGVSSTHRGNTGFGSDLVRFILDGSPLKPTAVLIPQESTRFTWGPWYALAAGGFGMASVEMDSSLTPENFGSKANMNNVGGAMAWYGSAMNIHYEESGEVSFAESPSTDLGEQLIVGGPYVSNISVNIGPGGISTSYSFKTFETRFGEIAKYTKDRIVDITNKLFSRIVTIGKEFKSGTGGLDVKTRRDNWKPNKKTFVSRWGGTTSNHMIVGEVFQETDDTTDQKIQEFFSSVAVQSTKQTVAQIGKDFPHKAAMTMDGLFRPFSTDRNYPSVAGAAALLPHFEDGGGGATPNVDDLDPFLVSTAGGDDGHDIQGISSGHDMDRDLNRRKARKGCQGENCYEEDGGDKEYDNQYRGVGLRAPLVVVGWGYDISGNPVPSNPNDKTAFLDNHKKRVDQWKAGPVDLRCDDTRKVWVAGGGGGAGADVWYSVMVDPAAINSSIQGASGATYNSLTCGSASSYCGGGCDHDAVAYFQAAEEPFYNDSNSPCPILKNHAVEIVIEEPRRYNYRNGACEAVLTDGGWLGQPLPAGYAVFTLDTGRTRSINGKVYPVHWVLQAQFCQTTVITTVGCEQAPDGIFYLKVGTRDLWTEGPITGEHLPMTMATCPAP